MPGAASRISRIPSSGTLCPVGLLGLVTNTTSGRRSRMAATEASISRVKSERRYAGTHSVWVPSAMIGCIEYDGTNPIAERPGPPNACEQLLQDLVGPVCSPEVFDAERDTGLPRQVRGEVGAQRDGVPVRVPVQLCRGLTDRFGDVVDERLRGRVRVLVGVELHRHRQLRCAVRRLAAQVLAKRQVVERDARAGNRRAGHRSASNRSRTASPCAGRSSAFARVIT